MSTIWCNADLSPKALDALRAGITGHQLLVSSERTANLGVGSPDDDLARADIAFGQPEPVQARELPGLKWIHITSAGYTRYDREDFRAALAGRNATFTNSSSVFDEPCAQHLLAFMLASARQLPQAMASQLGENKWNYTPLRSGSRLLRDQTVLILGYGAIGKRLAELLAPFDLKVIGVRRKVRGDEPIPTVELDKLPELLPTADHIVNILPANDGTDEFVNAAFLSQVKPGALFYNVGRGTTVDQDALIAALVSGQLGLAYLDVTDPEPLPSHDPLWVAPNCFITPHTAGGHLDEDLSLVTHFLANLRRFEKGEPLLDRVM